MFIHGKDAVIEDWQNAEVKTDGAPGHATIHVRGKKDCAEHASAISYEGTLHEDARLVERRHHEIECGGRSTA